MGRHLLVCLTLFGAACGGGGKKAANKPVQEVKAPSPPPETEADREKKRHDAAVAIVPEGSTCLPPALKEDGAPALEVGAEKGDAVVCAVDSDKARLLGPVACWKVDLSNGALTYQPPAPLPGRGFDAKLDGDHCARGFCLPGGANVKDGVVHLAWNLDGTKVAMLAGDDVHIFDAASKKQASSFSVRGDKGLTGEPSEVHFVGDNILVEGSDPGFSAVWWFKSDGTAKGPMTNIGGVGKDRQEKPISSWKGSFSILDPDHVAVAEHGMEKLTSYELSTGKRATLVRKIAKMSCKPEEVDAYWKGGDKVTDKCKDALEKQYGHLIGATAVMGGKSLVVALRGERTGELGVLDAKTLAEKKAIKLPWCGVDGGKSAATN